MRRQQYHVELTEQEYQMLLHAMMEFRNRVARENGPTEDVNDLILKITKFDRKRWLF